MRGLRLLSTTASSVLRHLTTVRSPPVTAVMATPTAGAEAPMRSKRPNSGSTQSWRKKKTKRERNMTEGTSEEVLRHDIEALLASRASAKETKDHGSDSKDPGSSSDGEPHTEAGLPAPGTETEVEVLELSSTGDGLAMRPGSDQVYVVPFTVPGDTVRVKVHRHVAHEKHSVADLVSVATPSPLRDDSRVRCRHFSRCGGCQFQMLDYPEQLRHKRRVVERAFANFSNLPAGLVPAVGDTIGSPLQYGYRTKLTPHFDGPPGFRHSRKKKTGEKPSFQACPDLGFMVKGQRRVMDIEDCPIGTDVVRLGMKRERARLREDFASYHRGATILLRENTLRLPAGEAAQTPPSPDTIRVPTTHDTNDFIDVKSCETDSKATTHEYIASHHFTNPAGSFFQNNNSILPVFTSYVRDHVLPPASPIKYLIDAYSGSGLFTITLASVFQHSTGIDIAADSIASARHNATLNGLGEDRCRFIAADAGELFKNVDYDPHLTAVILDPPRKGCDAAFLAQLRRFAPTRILYVSCNVHTQARDVGVLVRGDGDGARYEIESLRGFDFFPQTGHVEGFAILNRVECAE